MVGFVIPGPGDAFMAEMTLGLEPVLVEHAFLTVAVNTLKDGAREQQLERALRERQVDGIVVLPVATSAGLAAALSGRSVGGRRRCHLTRKGLGLGGIVKTHLSRGGDAIHQDYLAAYAKANG